MSRPLQNVGVPDVPSGGFARKSFDNWVRNQLLGLQNALVPPGTPSNVRATALAGSIQVDFTRSDAEGYILYWNSTPSVNGAVRIDLGAANKYVDNIGAGSVKRFYCLEPMHGSVRGPLSSWVSATTLALGTSITPPEPPPATETPFTDDETGGIAVQVPNKGSYEPL